MKCVTPLIASKNFNVSVQEKGNKIIFLRKLMPGEAPTVLGIHVAKLAGMPKKVLKRANQILLQLEEKNKVVKGKKQLNQLLQPQICSSVFSAR